MKNHPKVSVVLAVYNGADFLEEALKSILAQTMPDFELIIINDGSTDQTANIIKKFTDSRIILIHNKKNLGIAEATNIGLNHAKGIYIAHHDADDISLPNRFKEQCQALDNDTDLGLVGSNFHLIDKDRKIFDEVKFPHNYNDIQKVILTENCLCHGAIMFRSNILEEVGKYRNYFNYTEDYDFVSRIIEKYKTININKPLYQLRRGINSVSVKKLDLQMELHLIITKQIKMRQKHGTDNQNELEGLTPIQALINKFGLSKKEIVDFKNERMKGFCDQAVKSGHMLTILQIWWKFFKLQPQKWKIKYLFFCIKKLRKEKSCLQTI